MSSLEIKNETQQLFSEVYRSIDSIPSSAAPSLLMLSSIIPKLDVNIIKYKMLIHNDIDTSKSEGGKQAFFETDSTFGLINARIKKFETRRKPQILHLFSNFFNNLNNRLDKMTSDTVNANSNIERLIENHENDLKIEVSTMKDKFSREFLNISNQNERDMKEYTEKVNGNIHSISEKIENEKNRVISHYMKILDSKLESIVMTENAIEKAKREFKETVEKNHSEIQNTLAQNNDILKKYVDSVESTLKDDEDEVSQLSQKIEVLTKKYQNEIAPNLKFEKRKEELDKRYHLKDIAYENDKNNLLKEINYLIEQKNDLQNQHANLMNEQNNLLNQKKNEFEDMLIKIKVDERVPLIDGKKSEKKEKHKSKINRLKQNYQQLTENFENDIGSMKNRIKDKQSFQVERVRNLEVEQELFVDKIAEERKDIAEETQKLKEIWTSEKIEIENGYKSDISEVITKTKKEEKYFYAKSEALKKELHNILKENTKIFRETSGNISGEDYEIEEIKKNNMKIENDLKENLFSSNSSQVNEIVQQKMNELKQKHMKERNQLIQEINSYENQEKSLRKMYSDLTSHNNDHNATNYAACSYSDIKINTNSDTTRRINHHRKHQNSSSQIYKSSSNSKNNDSINSNLINNESSNSGSSSGRRNYFRYNSSSNIDMTDLSGRSNRSNRNSGIISNTSSCSGRMLISSFQSQNFIDAQLDKWREDHLVDCKMLKKEEANALKDLEKTKVDFSIAVKKTVELKSRIEETTHFFSETIEQMKGKNEKELQSLRETILQKGKEITELENQYKENEQELKRRTRQIEQAEDKLSKLRTQLVIEKNKIKERIKEDYQPQIYQEQRKTEIMVNEIEKLRNELELQIEFSQHDLYLVETANAAMEEELRKETEDLVKEMIVPFEVELKEKENRIQQEIDVKELQILNKVNEDTMLFEEEEKRITLFYEEKIRAIQETQKNEITELNDFCIKKISENSLKKKKADDLKNVKCEVCPKLNKYIKKLENVIIKMQENKKDLELDYINKIETVRRFHTRGGMRKLPLPQLNVS